METLGLPLEVILLAAGFLLLLSIVASKASTKLGIPALILFMGLGMLAGSEGPGRVDFDNASFARDIGIVALALILFAGGLETKWQDIKPVIFTGLSMATIGVLVTAGIMGTAASYLLGFPPVVGFLLGAIVSSTDAAAVFGVLRARNIHVKKGLTPLLELESGSNDPMAVFLTVGLTSVIMQPHASLVGLIPSFFIQMAVGSAVGYVLGIFGAWLINTLRLEYGGLYPAVTIGLAFIAYGGAEVIHGNPFLSVYICGLSLGNRNFLHRHSLMSFHDGLAWLTQILMFLVLGLLVFPSKLVEVAVPGLLLSALLVFVARPGAVIVSTLGAKWMTMNDRHFVAWTGLRGAVPIILATIPLTAGLPQAETIFNVVFFVVVTSVILQGSLIDKVADYLKVRAPGSESAEHSQSNTAEVTLGHGSPAAGRQVVDLKMPRSALLLLVTRDGESFVPQGSTVLQAGDVVLLATRKEDVSDLVAMIAGMEAVGSAP